jgi:hypothetical protein
MIFTNFVYFRFSQSRSLISVHCHCGRFSYKRVDKMWATRGFMVWLFLSLSIDYRIKKVKIRFGRINLLNFDHPISHCALESKNTEILLNMSDLDLRSLVCNGISMHRDQRPRLRDPESVPSIGVALYKVG